MEKTSPALSAWVRAPLVVGLCGWVLWREWRTPARRQVESKTVHSARNLAIAGAAAAVVQLAEVPVALRLSSWVEEQQWGLLNWLPLPAWVAVPLAVLALDYTLYLWHVATHRVPLLWRFHQPHHVDLDMDATTALRFHFGEILLSVGWRAAQITAIGVSPLAFSVWQTGLFISIFFHHSNILLNPETERRLGRWLITPRMHEIHHSNIQDEADSNWSSGLAIWDRLHGTLRVDVPRDVITIGVPSHSAPQDVTLKKTLEMPFVKQRPSWTAPDGGDRRSRPSAARGGGAPDANRSNVIETPE